jgi:hypothetical protein
MMMAVSSPVVVAHPQESSKSDSAPSERGEARKNKIEAFTIKQKAAEGKRAERREEVQEGSDSKARAPIGVNEPGVNRASKPLTVNEEGAENQPTKGSKRVAELTKQASPSEGKPGKGEPQPAKKQ